MGDEIFAYLFLSDPEDVHAFEAKGASTSDSNDQLLMSVEPDSDVSEGQELEVVFDRQKAHLFDTATGDAIAHDIHNPEASATAGTASEEVQSGD